MQKTNKYTNFVAEFQFENENEKWKKKCKAQEKNNILNAYDENKILFSIFIQNKINYGIFGGRWLQSFVYICLKYK